MANNNSKDTIILDEDSIGIIKDAQQSVDGFTQKINSLQEQIKNLDKALNGSIKLSGKETKAVTKAKKAKQDELDAIKKLNDAYQKVLQNNGINVRGRSEEQQSKDEKASEKLSSITSKFGYEAKVTNGKASFTNTKKESFAAVGDAMTAVGGKLGKFGGAITKVGGLLSKFAGPIGWVIQGLQLLGDALNAIAEVDAKQQDIQNQRNTNLTNRNISLQNIETEATTDTMNTVFENMMSDYNKAFVKLSGELAITNAKAVAYAETRIGAAIGDVNETAWNALAASTDIKAQQRKLGNEVQKTAAIENRAISQRTFELSGRNIERGYETQKKVLESQQKDFELTVQDKKNTYESPFASSINRLAGGNTEADHVAGDNSGKYESKYGKGERKGIEGRGVTGSTVAGMMNTVTLGVMDGIFKSGLTKQETVGKREFNNLTNDLNATSAAASNQIKLQNTAIENSNKMADRVSSDMNEMKNSVIDTETQIQKAYQKMAQTVEKWYMDFQDQSYESGINKGMTTKGQLDQYRQAMNDNLTVLAQKYGIKADEMFKMQSGYTAEGRSKMLSSEDMQEQAAFSKIYMGGDFDTTAELANQTEVFNMGVSDTVNLMGEMSKQVTKMGLDGRKYLKDATKYLKQAQKYTFKDGVKGMLKMAKTAQQIRFNMDSVPAMVDNIQDGGLEGIITKAAKLQVLGGRFAMGSDPIAMAYEAFNDPEALMKRFNSMTQGMGSFNKKTGEVTFNGMEQQQLKLLAEYSNQDVTDVMNQARYNVKKNKIDKSQISSDLDEEQRAALISKAYMKDGKWMVNDVTGNARDLSSINANNIKDVQADSYEGKMSQGMEQIVSFTKLFTGDQEARMSQFSSAMQKSGEADKELQDRLEQSKKAFADEFQKNTNEIITNMQLATAAYSEILNQYKENDPIKENVENIDKNTEKIKEVMNALSEKMGAEIKASTGKKVDKDWEDVEKNYEKGKDYKGASGYVSNIAQGQKLSFSRAKERWNKGSYVQAASELVGGAIGQLVGNIFGVSASNVDDFMHDGSVSGGGKPMTVSASKVTPINDGSVSGGGKPMTVSASKVTPINDGSVSGGGKPMTVSASKVTPINDGSVSGGGKPMTVSASKVTPINDGSVSGGGKPMTVSASKVTPINDGSVSGGGKPMTVSASKVTPINDGSVSGAISDPNDHAIFAKVGGPFDKLFNGVFKQVNALYQGILGGKNNVVPREPLGNNSEFAASDSLETFRRTISEAKNNAQTNNTNGGNSTFKVEITGKLMLDSNGKSIDIINELQNNPLMLQALSNMIANNISAKYNGGRPHLDAAFRN